MTGSDSLLSEPSAPSEYLYSLTEYLYSLTEYLYSSQGGSLQFRD
jgi:hypothetical protein